MGGAGGTAAGERAGRASGCRLGVGAPRSVAPGGGGFPEIATALIFTEYEDGSQAELRGFLLHVKAVESRVAPARQQLREAESCRNFRRGCFSTTDDT